MLEPVFPLAFGFESGSLETLQLMRFEVLPTLIVSVVVFGFGIEGISEVGVNGDEFTALLITQTTGFLGAGFELHGQRGCHLDGSAPRRGLLPLGGDALADLIIADSSHKSA